MAAHDRGKTRTGGWALLLALVAVPGAGVEAGWGAHRSSGAGASGLGLVAAAALRPVAGGRAARPLMLSGYAGEIYGRAPRRAYLPTSFGAPAGWPVGAPCGPCGSGR
jgi:hypothetical protein